PSRNVTWATTAGRFGSCVTITSTAPPRVPSPAVQVPVQTPMRASARPATAGVGRSPGPAAAASVASVTATIGRNRMARLPRASLALPVSLLRVLFQDGACRHLGGALAVAAFPLGRFLDVLVLPL